MVDDEARWDVNIFLNVPTEVASMVGLFQVISLSETHETPSIYRFIHIWNLKTS